MMAEFPINQSCMKVIPDSPDSPDSSSPQRQRSAPSLSNLIGPCTTLGLWAGSAWLAHGEDSIGYRYSNYQEEGGRIAVETHATDFSLAMSQNLTVKGSLVYDAISGATPTGAPPPDGNGQVPLVQLKDTRRAISIASAWQQGRYLTTPQVSYSKERDYESTGLSLNESIDFNQKNTTLKLGLAHDFDRVLPNHGEWIRDARSKENTDALLGLVQLLDPYTFININLTIGYGSGFLTDAYKRVVFPEFSPDIALPEKRPDFRFRQVIHAAGTHFFPKLNAAAELSYRFHHDSYEIVSHTATLEWRQKLGKRLTVSPMVRFYEQSAASFYAPTISGDPRPDQGSPIPDAYSSDYRLSELRSWTVGASVNVKVTDFCTLDLGYQRYEMLGLDRVTSASAYPKANVFSIGLHLTV